MVNKKKRGSSILLVLMVATVMIIISSVVASSLVSTTRMNTIEKREDDISYAAEAGIEQVLSNARKGDYGSLVVGDYITPFNLNTTFISQEIEVEVTGIIVDVAGKKTIHATSIAKDTRNAATKEVQGHITENNIHSGGTSNLLKYSICGNNVNIYSSGALFGAVASLNGTNNYTTEIEGAMSSTPNMGETFIVPKFKESLIPKVSIPIQIKTIDDWNNIPDNKGGMGIDKPYKGAIKLNNLSMQIVLVNAPNIIIDSGVLASIARHNVIVFSSGNITVAKTNVIGTGIDIQTGNPFRLPIDFYAELGAPLQLTGISFVGDTVNFYNNGALTIDWPTYSHPNSPINDSNLTDMNTFLQQYMDSSWSGGVGGTVSTSYEITDVIYP